MSIATTGEFALIKRLAPFLGAQRPDVVVGIGDDTAVLDLGSDTLWLVTTDALVENVHFRHDWMTPQEIGQRALAVNLSDIAAMGGIPAFALISLALPANTQTAWVEAVYKGMHALAQQHNVAIVGGNLASIAATVVIDVTLIGHAPREQVLLRSGARIGDNICVTGGLGLAEAGLWIRERELEQASIPEASILLARLNVPTARIAESSILAGSRQVSAMIDLSDGLSGDLGHICDQSNVGMRLWADKLPTHPGITAVAAQTGRNVLDMLLHGGGDYELCFTVAASSANALCAEIEQTTGSPAHIIGQVVAPEEGRLVHMPDGQLVPLVTQSWNHFRQGDNT